MNLPKDILKIIISKTDLPFNEISTLSKDICALSFATYNFKNKINFPKLIDRLCETDMCDTYFLASPVVIIKYLILNPSVNKKEFANYVFRYMELGFRRNIDDILRGYIFTENCLCDYLCNFFTPKHKKILACYFMRYENPDRDKNRIEALLIPHFGKTTFCTLTNASLLPPNTNTKLVMLVGAVHPSKHPTVGS